MHTSAASQSDTTKESCDSGKITIELKRTKEEVFINPYNETLLRAWGANVDLQFVTNAHAVIRYILDYMCKPERELGETMKAAMKDLPDKCLPRERLKKLGNVFINSRMLSAQEAAVRAIGLPMRQLSRSVVFVNSDLPQNRTHILKSKAELDQLDKDSEDVFRDGLIEKYAARPPALDRMCLAEFASLYKTCKKKLQELCPVAKQVTVVRHQCALRSV